MTRNEQLLSMFDASGIGLEIGPGFNPFLPKSAGYRIETVDHATADVLREKYRNDPHVDIAGIEDVDFVTDGRTIAEAVGKPGYYDFIVASHVIEHAPDMLAFLKDCETLLKQNGTLVLAVPDKRRCFDLMQPLTSTGMILQAHEERRTRHPPSALFDDIAYNLLRDGLGGWAKEHAGRLTFVRDLTAAHHFFNDMRRSSGYIDTHAWRFTPSSFRLIASDLHSIGEIRLREQAFHSTDTHEFYIALSQNGQGCPVDRLALARMIIVEHQEVTLDPEDLASSECMPPPADEARMTTIVGGAKGAKAGLVAVAAEEAADQTRGTFQAETQRLKEKLNIAGMEADELRGEVEALKAEIGLAEMRLSAMLNSRSWRITEPLRRIMVALRGR